MAGVQVGDTSVGDITRGGGGDVVRETDATVFVVSGVCLMMDHGKADRKPLNQEVGRQKPTERDSDETIIHILP